MPTTMQQKRGTSARWTELNPILLDGEIGVESNTKKMKVGDGVTHWNNLEYVQVDAAEIAYTHTQNAQLSVWHITHSLSFIPNVFITDFNGNPLECDVQYIGSNQIVVTLSEPYIGYAYLS